MSDARVFANFYSPINKHRSMSKIAGSLQARFPYRPSCLLFKRFLPSITPTGPIIA
jgi:hypothetical protein